MFSQFFGSLGSGSVPVVPPSLRRSVLTLHIFQPRYPQGLTALFRPAAATYTSPSPSPAPRAAVYLFSATLPLYVHHEEAFAVKYPCMSVQHLRFTGASSPPRPLFPCQALAETKKELLKAATAAGEAAADAERLRRHVKSVEGEVSAQGAPQFVFFVWCVDAASACRAVFVFCCRAFDRLLACLADRFIGALVCI